MLERPWHGQWDDAIAECHQVFDDLATAIGGTEVVRRDQGATRHGDSVVHVPSAAVAHAFVLSA